VEFPSRFEVFRELEGIGYFFEIRLFRELEFEAHHLIHGSLVLEVVDLDSHLLVCFRLIHDLLLLFFNDILQRVYELILAL
jgi:hypothetical protein